MAVLENTLNNKRVVLRAHHTFGRHKSAADTLLDGKDVSNIHASIRWDGLSWTITDHSKNGTWISGKQLNNGASQTLKALDMIQFGRAPESVWKISDLRPPTAVLVPMDNSAAIIELNNIHALPDEATPELSLYMSDDGQWMCEDKSGPKRLGDGDIVRLGNDIWQFYCSDSVDATLEASDKNYSTLEQVSFEFRVSLDEEHVFLSLDTKKTKYDLGERTHHYLLLTLARQRLKDSQSGYDPNEQGWIELSQLSSMLGLEPSHLNIQIFRARKQVSEALSETMNLPQVVERRKGDVRFAFSSFRIMRGSTLEGELINQATDNTLS